MRTCWITSLAIQQFFPIQILLKFLRFKFYIQNIPSFIFKHGSSTYFSLLFSFLVFTKCQVLSHDQVLQRAYFVLTSLETSGWTQDSNYEMIKCTTITTTVKNMIVCTKPKPCSTVAHVMSTLNGF